MAKTIKTTPDGYINYLFDQVCPALDDAIDKTHDKNLVSFREDLHTLLFDHFKLGYGFERKSEQPINDIQGVFEEFIDDCRDMGMDRLL